MKPHVDMNNKKADSRVGYTEKKTVWLCDVYSALMIKAYKLADWSGKKYTNTMLDGCSDILKNHFERINETHGKIVIRTVSSETTVISVVFTDEKTAEDLN